MKTGVWISQRILQVLVTFKDRTIDFTLEELGLLDTLQKKLLRDVMLENVNHPTSVDYSHSGESL